MNIKVIGLLVGLLLLSIVYGIFSATEKSNPDIRGNIINIHLAHVQGDNLMGSVLIEGTMNGYPQPQNVSVTITEETSIFEEQGGNRRKVTFNSLEVGQKVDVRLTGPVAQSYPVQATAAEIVMLK